MSNRKIENLMVLALILLLTIVVLSFIRPRYFREGMTVTDVKVSVYDKTDQHHEGEIQLTEANSDWITTPLATGFKKILLPWFTPEVSSESIHIILDGHDEENKPLNRDLTFYSSGLVVVISNGDPNNPGDFYRLVEPEYGYDFYLGLLKGVRD